MPIALAAAETPRVTDETPFAVCPLCQTVDAVVTEQVLALGNLWQCGRCGQSWTASRLATVNAYAAWDLERRLRLA